MNLLCILLAYLLLFTCTPSAAELFPPFECGNNSQTICRSNCYEELAYCPPEGIPHTFLWTRPVYRNIAAQDASWHDIINNYTSGQFFGAQIIGFYQNSKATSGINQFFLFGHNSYPSIKGDAVVLGNSNLRDIRAEWLQLPSDFIATIHTKPHQQQTGFWLEASMDLSKLFCHEYFERLWLGIVVPFQIVKNSVNLEQTLLSAGTNPLFATGAVGALNNPSFEYARFGPQQSASGASEINFRLGTKLLDKDGFQIAFYSLFLMPLHTNAGAEFVFSPIVGNNRHFGAGSGLMFQLPLNYPCDTLASFVFEAETIYFFRNNQRRTFDLKGKPWSRYLLYNDIEGLFNIPGPQLLSQKVQIKPYNMVEATGALRLDSGLLQGELGYHVWAKGRETLKLIHPFPEKYGIAGDGTLIPTTNVRATASRSTIAHLAANDINPLTGDPIFVTIKEKDLELHSGASPAAISHMIYLSGSYTASSGKGDLIVNLGIYGEIPQYSTSMATVGFWGKLALYC